jgi:hypothetical protein
MAASLIAKPGTKFGPCKDACEHVDCRQSRELVNTCCFFCHSRIGYNKMFVTSGKRAAHDTCCELAVENGDARVQQFLS